MSNNNQTIQDTEYRMENWLGDFRAQRFQDDIYS